MNTMKTISKILLAAVVLAVILNACKKEKPEQQYRYGFITAELIGLPGTKTLDMYIDGQKVDTLPSGFTLGIATKIRIKAEQPLTIAFKKKGTDTTVLDTSIITSRNNTVALKLAVSAAMGIESFQTTSVDTIPADSALVFLYNSLPVELMAEDQHVDIILQIQDENSSYQETGIMWTDVQRNKLHPQAVMLKILDPAEGQYVIRIKDRATGNFLQDAYMLDSFPLTLQAGQKQIMNVYARAQRNRLKIYVDSSVF